MDNFIKIVKSLEHGGLLLKGVTEKVQNEIKEQRTASLLGNFLTGKGAIATSHRRVVNKKGNGINRAGEGVIRAGYGNKKF